MKRTTLILAVLFASLSLQSCATSHAARWSFGLDSAYATSETNFTNAALKPVIGVPLIVGGAAWDIVTLPIQAIFGVWPLWGGASKHMKPGTKGVNGSL